VFQSKTIGTRARKMALRPLEKRQLDRIFESFSPGFLEFFSELPREGAKKARTGRKKVVVGTTPDRGRSGCELEPITLLYP
jgi:hypothetical protein